MIFLQANKTASTSWQWTRQYGPLGCHYDHIAVIVALITPLAVAVAALGGKSLSWGCWLWLAFTCAVVIVMVIICFSVRCASRNLRFVHLVSLNDFLPFIYLFKFSSFKSFSLLFLFFLSPSPAPSITCSCHNLILFSPSYPLIPC